MTEVDTIINHRNMRVIYLIWASFLLTLGVYGVIAYTLQLNTPFMAQKSQNLIIILGSSSGALAILAILFKKIFKQELMAWLLADVIGVFGLVLFLIYGWNAWFYVFFAVSALLLLYLGPYLHFD